MAPAGSWTGYFPGQRAFVLGSTLGAPGITYADAIDAELYECMKAIRCFYGLGDRRLLELEPTRTYLLASDGLWHLPHPQQFIDVGRNC